MRRWPVRTTSHFVWPSNGSSTKKNAGRKRQTQVAPPPQNLRGQLHAGDAGHTAHTAERGAQWKQGLPNLCSNPIDALCPRQQPGPSVALTPGCKCSGSLGLGPLKAMLPHSNNHASGAPARPSSTTCRPSSTDPSTASHSARPAWKLQQGDPFLSGNLSRSKNALPTLSKPSPPASVCQPPIPSRPATFPNRHATLAPPASSARPSHTCSPPAPTAATRSRPRKDCPSTPSLAAQQPPTSPPRQQRLVHTTARAPLHPPASSKKYLPNDGPERDRERTRESEIASVCLCPTRDSNVALPVPSAPW